MSSAFLAPVPEDDGTVVPANLEAGAEAAIADAERALIADGRLLAGTAEAADVTAAGTGLPPGPTTVQAPLPEEAA